VDVILAQIQLTADSSQSVRKDDDVHIVDIDDRVLETVATSFLNSVQRRRRSVVDVVHLIGLGEFVNVTMIAVFVNCKESAKCQRRTAEWIRQEENLLVQIKISDILRDRVKHIRWWNITRLVKVLNGGFRILLELFKRLNKPLRSRMNAFQRSQSVFLVKCEMAAQNGKKGSNRLLLTRTLRTQVIFKSLG